LITISDYIYIYIISITIASSGIASQLIPGGRTAHSRFGIPLDCHEDSTCNIMQGSHLAGLIQHTKLIIWDEAPMCNRYCFEALDRSLHDIMRFINSSSEEIPFGGKVVVFGGDYRQDIVMASLSLSHLWSSFKVLSLSKNMRLNNAKSTEDAQEISEFSKWTLAVGDGSIGEVIKDGLFWIEIPMDLLSKYDCDPVQAISNSIYPDLSLNSYDYKYFTDRAILAPTFDEVDDANNYLLDQIAGDEKIYLSSNNICENSHSSSDASETYTTEFLNTITAYGMPSHEIRLKVGSPIMLI